MMIEKNILETEIEEDSGGTNRVRCVTRRLPGG